MSQDASTGQKWSVLLLAVILICLSVGTTLHFSGFPLDFWNDHAAAGEPRYRHITLTDAELACTARAEEAFGDRLSNLRVDRFSSRLDRASEQFKVFMEADIYTNSARSGVARDTFINCFTATDAPDIQLFQYAKDGTQFIAPGEEGRGMFGL